MYRSPSVRDRLADAWAWLESNGLVGFQPAQSFSALARRVTAAGTRALQDSGFQRLQAAVRLNSELHPALASTSVRSQFLIGDYELEAFVSLRQVEIRVRSLGGYPDDLLGMKLMERAFSPGAGPLCDPSADPGEQQARMALFRGAIGTFKNPTSHRAVGYDSPTLASEIIMLADLLMRLLDQAQARQDAAAQT